jgi:hypothetical protein
MWWHGITGFLDERLGQLERRAGFASDVVATPRRRNHHLGPAVAAADKLRLNAGGTRARIKEMSSA